MKNVLRLKSLLLVALLVMFQFSCDEDLLPELPTPPDATGKWQLTAAVLVEPDPLTITNFLVEGNTLVIPAGVDGATNTLTVVGGALAGAACEDQQNFGTFNLELMEDGKKLFFNCPAENNYTEEAGTWVFLPNTTDGEFTILTLTVSVAGQNVPIIVNDFEMAEDQNSFTGQATGYPMIKDFAYPIGATLPDESINLQTMTVDMTFERVQ